MKNRKWKEEKLRAKRERKHLKRISSGPEYINPIQSPYSKEYNAKANADRKRIDTFQFELDKFLNEKGNVFTGLIDFEIDIPEIFCLEKNYVEVIRKLSEIRTTIISMKYSLIRFNFAKTKIVSFEVLFLLKVLTEEYLKFLKKCQFRLETLNIIPSIKIRRSSTHSVNTKLFANGIINRLYESEDELDLNPVTRTDFIYGSKMRNGYDENKKGYAGTKIRELINQALSSHLYELNTDGVNSLDGIISEILNNAEDHSYFHTWYAFGNLFESNKNVNDNEFVGEINLAFLNFGFSIYEGFVESKDENFELFDYMSELAENVKYQDRSKPFSKESLFTLYALQDGYSRLKNSEESRGTGTMKFINSFLYLGDYEDRVKNYIPKLLIYSGRTTLICDNTYRPFQHFKSKDEPFFLSLNTSKDLKIAPERSHLIENDVNFPGTFLVVKIYLNKRHLDKKVDERTEND